MATLKVVENPNPSPLRALVRDWLADVKAGGASLRTLESYQQAVERVLLPFCEREGVTSVEQIDQRLLNKLNTELLDGVGRAKPLSRASIASYLRQCNVFLKWAHQQGEGTGARAKLPKLERKVLQTLERSEIQRLEDAADSERDRLLVRTLADTGIRLGELLSLRVDDLTASERGATLLIQGKGRKERPVPIKPALARRLRNYIRNRPTDADSDRIFLTRRRSRITGGYEPLSKRAVEGTLNSLAAKAGLEDRPHNPHSLRHAYITHLIREGMNAIQVATLVGHKDLSMIMGVYSHVQGSDLRDTLNRLLAD